MSRSHTTTYQRLDEAYDHVKLDIDGLKLGERGDNMATGADDGHHGITYFGREPILHIRKT